ncbi:flagellar assembly protein A [Sulfurimonas sp.]
MANFTPFTKTSINIINTIKEAAKDRNIKKEDVDFELIGVTTLIQSDKHKDWTIIDEPVEKLFDKKTLKSKSFQIRQEYEINIKPYKKNTMFENMQMSIASNKTKSKVVATFEKGTLFPCSKNLAALLKREINHKKLRLGILIEHFEVNLNSTLIKLAQVIECKTPLSKDIKIVIAQSPGAILPIDDSIVVHHEKNQEEKKSFIAGVDANELVFEYMKPKKGSNGRSTTGEYIVAPEPKTTYASYAPDLETIKIEEDENSIKYYSLVDGYVKDSGRVISISKEVAIKSAKFSNTGSINTGEDKDISVSINQSDSSDDAVGSGVSIDVKKLDVKGTVGSSTKIKANNLSVEEQTHRNSQIEAIEDAKIHLHRGKLKAKTADINILENGTVEADDIKVEKMLGGEVIGHRVIIEEITSNTVVIASESIEVHKISGEHNKLIIDPNKIETHHEEIEKIKEEISTAKTVLSEMKEENEKKVSEHAKRAERIKVFKKRILAATKASKAPNKADVLRIKQYKIDAETLKEKLETIKAQEDKIESKNIELNKLYELELHAVIINKDKYDGHTKVIFVDTKTSQEYTMTPDGVYEKLFLKKDGNEKVVTW